MTIPEPTPSPLTSLHSQLNLEEEQDEEEASQSAEDSPLSDDSLSSAGASTEPLPASEDRLNPSTSPPHLMNMKLMSAKQLAGGDDSDSSLTEQSSSEGEENNTNNNTGRNNNTSKNKKLMGNNNNSNSNGRGRGRKPNNLINKSNNINGSSSSWKGKNNAIRQDSEDLTLSDLPIPDEDEEEEEEDEEQEEEDQVITPRGKQVNNTTTSTSKLENYSSEDEEGEIHSDSELTSNRNKDRLPSEVVSELSEQEDDDEEEEVSEEEEEEPEVEVSEEEVSEEEEEDDSMNQGEDNETTPGSNNNKRSASSTITNKKSQTSNKRFKIDTTSERITSTSSSLQSDEGEEEEIVEDQDQVLQAQQEEEEEGEAEEEEIREETIIPKASTSKLSNSTSKLNRRPAPTGAKRGRPSSNPNPTILATTSTSRSSSSSGRENQETSQLQGGVELEEVLPASNSVSRAPSTEAEAEVEVESGEGEIITSKPVSFSKGIRGTRGKSGKSGRGRGRGRYSKVTKFTIAKAAHAAHAASSMIGNQKGRSRSTSVENQIQSESEILDDTQSILASPIASSSTLPPLPSLPPTTTSSENNLTSKNLNKNKKRKRETLKNNGGLSAAPSIADSSLSHSHLDEEDIGVGAAEDSEIEGSTIVRNGNGNEVEEDDLDEEEVEEEEEEEDEEEEEREERIQKSNNRKGGNSKIDKRTKAFRRKENQGKEKISQDLDLDLDEEEEIEDPEEDEYAGSDHEEDTNDDFSQRKREEAMEALTKIEIEFARLRDRLYLERMADVERERIGVETGTHPDLLHLTQLIELRRSRKLELAKKWLEGAEGSFERSKDADEHSTWTWWSDGRDELRTTMLEEAHSKRRKLEREKRSLDRPKDDGLSMLLAPRPPPAIPLSYRRKVGFENEVILESEIAWAMKQPDLRVDPSVSALNADAAWTDLERMGLREPLRHANVYPFDSGYGSNLIHSNGPSFNDPRLGVGGPMSFGYSSNFDSNQSQHHFGGGGGGGGGGGPSSLPPLPTGLPNRLDYQPQQQQNTARVVSNPRVVGYSNKEQQQRPLGGAQSNRAYPSAHFPSAFDLEVERLQGQWTLPKSTPTPTPPVFQFDEIRRNGSNGPNGLTASSLGDSIDLTTSNNHSRRTNEETIISESHGSKPRFTLDEHMSRSPKPSPKVKVDNSSRINPSYMSIPAFVPHHNQHSQSPKRTIQPETLPQPPVLPKMKQQVVEGTSTALLPPLPALPALPLLPSLPVLSPVQQMPPVLSSIAFNSLPELPLLPPVISSALSPLRSSTPTSIVPDIITAPLQLGSPSPLATPTLFPAFSATTTQFPSQFPLPPQSPSIVVNHNIQDLTAVVTPSVIPVVGGQ